MSNSIKNDALGKPPRRKLKSKHRPEGPLWSNSGSLDLTSYTRGFVHLIEETKVYGTNKYKKRRVVIEQGLGHTSNFIPVEFTQDNCDPVDELNIGDEIEIEYRLHGRQWRKDCKSEVKFFLSIQVVDFKKLMGQSASDKRSQSNTRRISTK